MSIELTTREEKLGFSFADKDILRSALTHRSYLNEHPDFPLDHNERLEFLGDAVLELVVTDFLYKNRDLAEGDMTNLRASIVRGQMLARVSEELGFDEYLLLSHGEKKDTGKARQYILANAMEAVIGALYLDQGYEAAQVFIQKNIISKLEEVEAQGLHIDSKSKFQEIAQEQFRVTPVYKVLDESGMDHVKEFMIGVFLGDKQYGSGSGSSKQEAQQDAAHDALEQLGHVHNK